VRDVLRGDQLERAGQLPNGAGMGDLGLDGLQLLSGQPARAGR
jgi:hypothetical protein